LLDIEPGETVSALQKIKANPAKSSAPAMNALMHKMAAIEATGILGIDLSWLIRMQADTARELDEQMCQQRKTIKVALSGILTRTSSSLLLPVRASGTFCRITKRSSTARFFQFLPLYECRCRNIMFYRRRPLLKT